MTHEQLWLEERPRLEAHLRQRLTHDAAQEVVDEAFARLRGTAPSAGQLWQTAFNIEKEHARAAKRKTVLDEQVALLNGRAIPSIETAIIRADFDRAFRALPREQQEAFALVELRGLTHQEAADVLDQPLSTVHWRCEAARSRLKEELS